MAADSPLRFLPAAGSELVEAAVRYEQMRDGLGERFVEAVDRVLASIVAEPERWPLVPGVPPRRGARRRVLRNFPYAVVYRTTGAHQVEVVAVAHQKRRPGYWAKR